MLCFRKLPVARNSMDKRRGYRDFSSKVFCTSNPKTLASEPFCCVSENFRYRKRIIIRGGVSSFSVESFFCLEVPKEFVR